jgi:hypothetical protein
MAYNSPLLQGQMIFLNDSEVWIFVSPKAGRSSLHLSSLIFIILKLQNLKRTNDRPFSQPTNHLSGTATKKNSGKWQYICLPGYLGAQ